MGIKNFSRDMLKQNLKDSYVYIGSIIFITLIMISCINISNNEALYRSVEGKKVLVYKQMKGTPYTEVTNIEDKAEQFGDFKLVEVPLIDVQKEFLLITVLVIASFTFISSRNFVKKRSKELGFIILNGANTYEVSYYIRYTCSRIFLVGASIGSILGILLIPLVNILMYKALGIEGEAFLYSSDSFLVGLGFLFINYIFLMIVGTSEVYRKEVIEIINYTSTKKVKDKREFKFPSIIYLILYLLPLGIIFIPSSSGDISGLAKLGVYLSVVSSLGVIALFIPKHIKFLNNLKWMDDKKRKIYINNALIKLRESMIYIFGAGMSINYFTGKLIDHSEVKELVFVIFICMTLISSTIAMYMMVNILENGGIDKKFYKTLSAMGYNLEELRSISTYELLSTVGFIVIGLFFPIAFGLMMQLKNGTLGVDIILIVAIISIAPVIISGVVGYFRNKKRVTIFLDTEIKTKDSVLENTALKVFDKADLLVEKTQVFEKVLKNIWEKEIF